MSDLDPKLKTFRIKFEAPASSFAWLNFKAKDRATAEKFAAAVVRSFKGLECTSESRLWAERLLFDLAHIEVDEVSITKIDELGG